MEGQRRNMETTSPYMEFLNNEAHSDTNCVRDPKIFIVITKCDYFLPSKLFKIWSFTRQPNMQILQDFHLWKKIFGLHTKEWFRCVSHISCSFVHVSAFPGSLSVTIFVAVQGLFVLSSILLCRQCKFAIDIFAWCLNHKISEYVKNAVELCHTSLVRSLLCRQLFYLNEPAWRERDSAICWALIADCVSLHTRFNRNVRMRH